MEGTKAKCGIRLRNEALFRTLLLGNLGSFPLLKGMRQKCLQEISLQRVKIIYEATAQYLLIPCRNRGMGAVCG